MNTAYLARIAVALAILFGLGFVLTKDRKQEVHCEKRTPFGTLQIASYTHWRPKLTAHIGGDAYYEGVKFIDPDGKESWVARDAPFTTSFSYKKWVCDLSVVEKDFQVVLPFKGNPSQGRLSVNVESIFVRERGSWEWRNVGLQDEPVDYDESRHYYFEGSILFPWKITSARPSRDDKLEVTQHSMRVDSFNRMAKPLEERGLPTYSETIRASVLQRLPFKINEHSQAEADFAKSLQPEFERVLLSEDNGRTWKLKSLVGIGPFSQVTMPRITSKLTSDLRK